jgi:hypothetical protein
MKQKHYLELIWWVITVLITIAVLFPIYSSLPSYRFGWINIIYIVSFITVSRYIFLLQHTFLARIEYLKVILIFLCIPAVFLLVQELNLFQTYIDEEGVDALVGSLPYDKRDSMIAYIRNQMFFFGIGSIVSCVLLPFRLILSIWRGRNRGTV